MKRPEMVIALAMTWDGVRQPTRSLPPKARAFLARNSTPLPPQKKLAMLFADDRVNEIRVCWVPKLLGGDDVLCGPFAAPSSKRVHFRPARTVRFGDVLGVTYRRAAGK